MDITLVCLFSLANSFLIFYQREKCKYCKDRNDNINDLILILQCARLQAEHTCTQTPCYRFPSSANRERRDTLGVLTYLCGCFIMGALLRNVQPESFQCVTNNTLNSSKRNLVGPSSSHHWFLAARDLAINVVETTS